MTRALRPIACLLVIRCVGCYCIAAQEHAGSADRCRHWGTIAYPRMAVATSGTQRAIWTHITNRCDWDGMLVVFSVTEKLAPEGMESSASPPGATAALHMEDGAIVAPSPCPLRSPERSLGFSKGTFSVSSVTWSHSFLFRWQEKPLQQAWVEIRAEEGVYWLEIPYGLTQDSGTQLVGPDAEGSQRSCPAPGASPPDDVARDAEILPWACVSYKLDGAKDMWVVTARLSNPFDAECELSIRPLRDSDLHAPEEWSLHEPPTAVAITDGDRTVRNGRAASVSLHEEGRERRDTFRFARYIKAGRCWGTLTVRVGDNECSVSVPSSLYRSWHGHARNREASEEPPANPELPETGP